MKRKLLGIKGKYENHHILPKCLNGSDEPYNLVKLSAREHYIAHKLLIKIYPNEQCLKSAMIFFNSREEIRNSKSFEEIRNYSKQHNPMFNDKHKKKARDKWNEWYESKRYCKICGKKLKLKQKFCCSVACKNEYMKQPDNEISKILSKTRKNMLNNKTPEEMKKYLDKTLGNTDHIKRCQKISETKRKQNSFHYILEIDGDVVFDGIEQLSKISEKFNINMITLKKSLDTQTERKLHDKRKIMITRICDDGI